MHTFFDRFAVIAVLMMTTMIADSAPDSPRSEPSLREVFAPHFAIGFGTGVATGPREDLVRRHASTATCENVLKPRALRPGPDVFTWEKADAWVAWCESLGVTPVGHTLVWSYMMPEWLLERARSGALSREEAIAWQDAHIRAVVGRYGARISTWDVVNEALADGEASDRLLRSDPWLDLVGEAGIVAAFRSARAAAPDAKLVYNDYNLEQPEKLGRLLRLVRLLEAEGCRPDAIGIQGHCNLFDNAPALLEQALGEIRAAGYPVHITELDVSVYRWTGGANLQIQAGEAGASGYMELPEELQQRLADRYRELFAVFLRHDESIERVTFWNIDDGNTWLNNWPVKGRRNHPLLFDAQQQPKPAFHAVVGLISPP